MAMKTVPSVNSPNLEFTLSGSGLNRTSVFSPFTTPTYLWNRNTEQDVLPQIKPGSGKLVTCKNVPNDNERQLSALLRKASGTVRLNEASPSNVAIDLNNLNLKYDNLCRTNSASLRPLSGLMHENVTNAKTVLCRQNSKGSISDQNGNDGKEYGSSLYCDTNVEESLPKGRKSRMKKKHRKKSAHKNTGSRTPRMKLQKAGNPAPNFELSIHSINNNGPKSSFIQCQPMQVHSKSAKLSHKPPQLRSERSVSLQRDMSNTIRFTLSQGLANAISSVPSRSETTVRISYDSSSNSGSPRVAPIVMQKVTKVYLSDRQSVSVMMNGMEVPCAPPVTPTPEHLLTHEYVPSMSDIRSQRAVITRLKILENNQHKKREKEKAEKLKIEKQNAKDQEKEMKHKQRLQIYALNKTMTELENKNFLEFCKTKGVGKIKMPSKGGV